MTPYYFMFMTKHWPCFAKPDGDNTIVADVKTNFPGYIS